MKRWLQYHGLGLALILLGFAAGMISNWEPPGGVLGILLAVMGIFQAIEGQHEWQDHLRTKREAG